MGRNQLRRGETGSNKSEKKREPGHNRPKQRGKGGRPI